MHIAQEKRDKQPARLTVTLDERDHSEVYQLAEKNDVRASASFSAYTVICADSPQNS